MIKQFSEIKVSVDEIDGQDSMQVIVHRDGFFVRSFNWAEARDLALALDAAISGQLAVGISLSAARSGIVDCLDGTRYTVSRMSRQILIKKNGVVSACLSMEQAKEFGAALKAKSLEAEQQHWVNCERRLGKEITTKWVLGLPLLHNPRELERL